MRPNMRLYSMLGIGGIVIGALAASPGIAAAAAAHPAHFGTQTCTGTVSAPGVLAGVYGNVVVDGDCVADAGPAVVTGNLTIAAGGGLTAIFGLDDKTGSGNSDVTVRGDLIVESGGSLLLGCDSTIITTWGETALQSHPSFPCLDDPDQAAPTLSSHDVIDGSLIAADPLGVVLHHTLVRGDVTERKGGAGLGCVPAGIFKQYLHYPEYSDYEDNTIDGNVALIGLDTCWFGTHRNTVHGSMTVDDNVCGKDCMEVDSSIIYGNLSCWNNSPAVELGDGDGTPDQVGGNATGECGFNVLLPNPAPDEGIDVTPTYQPAAVKLHHH
jgi:hypothetical protein